MLPFRDVIEYAVRDSQMTGSDSNRHTEPNIFRIRIIVLTMMCLLPILFELSFAQRMERVPSLLCSTTIPVFLGTNYLLSDSKFMPTRQLRSCWLLWLLPCLFLAFWSFERTTRVTNVSFLPLTVLLVLRAGHVLSLESISVANN